MNRFTNIFARCLALFALAAFTSVNPCNAQTTSRPLSDWLSAQGTTSTFTPPIPDFVGWYDPTYFAGVDYAGLAAQYLATHGGPNLGTIVTGGVTETLQSDGTVEVTVTVNARNALAWATLAAGDPATGPTVFGSRAVDLLTNPSAPIALVSSSLKITFTNPAPGAPLPDFMGFLTGAVPFTLKNLTYTCSGPGPLADGSPGRMTISQVGHFNTPFMGANADAFPVEKIKVK
jgi:hypothetical protein